MKHILVLLTALLQTQMAALCAEQPPVKLPLWPAGKMPGVGATEPEKETPSKGDGVIRLTNISEPALTVFPAPSATVPAPAVIICPGGGYQILAINREGTAVAEWLNTHGITGIVLKYRVPNNRDGALQDIQRAVRLARARQKEWNIDGTRLGVMGFSAGGHLCARLSTSHGTASYPAVDEADRLNDRPDFAVLVYPAYLGGDGGLAPDIRVSANVPPCFIAHSDDDKRFVAGSKVFVEALSAAKVTHEFALYPTGGHGYGLHSAMDARAWPDRCSAWLKTIRVLPRDGKPSDNTRAEPSSAKLPAKP
jgi:acetyl esterase/lipase